MAHGYGLGKSRTKLGSFLDANGLTQMWLERHAGISNPTMVRLCGDRDYEPSLKIKIVIVKVLQEEVDPHASIHDFW